jgi:NADH-quinone oxidoreductase subunit K
MTLKAISLIIVLSNLWLFVYINLFSFGFVNVALSKTKNLLVVLMGIEIMLFGVGFGFVAHSVASSDFKGQVYALLLLMLAAGESALGLGLIVASYRVKGNIDVSGFNGLKS